MFRILIALSCHLLLLSLLAISQAHAAEDIEQLLVEARAALRQGNSEEAAKFADRAVAADGKNAEAHYLRGTARDAFGKHAQAIEDLSHAIELRPKYAAAYNARGSAHFKLAHIDESIADFDKFIEIEPQQEPGHWRRGISYYYAGRFAEGARQFEGYQTVDDNDVENAVWHFLCNARAKGVQHARGALLKIVRDPRIPLMTVYAMLRGAAKPEDVLAATRESNPPAEILKRRLFYAHLYLGLHYEGLGDADKSLEHIRLAAADYKLPGYMWEVARVHVKLREGEEEEEASQ